MSYSVPVDARMSLAELKEHLHHAPRAARLDPLPHLVLPRATGASACSHDTLLGARGRRVRGAHRHHASRPGTSPTASASCRGETEDEVLISRHVCHPSLANDNLSGIAVATLLARASRRRCRCGSPTASCSSRARSARSRGWRATRNGRRPDQARAGPHRRRRPGPAHLQAQPARRRRRSTAPSRTCSATPAATHEVVDFSPYGYDERQYCSPGFDLPGRLLHAHAARPLPRVPHVGRRPRLRPAGRASPTRSSSVLAVARRLEGNATLPEPQPRSASRSSAGAACTGPAAAARTRASSELALLWVLNLSDGRHSLLDIAERSGLRVRRRSGPRPTALLEPGCSRRAGHEGARDRNARATSAACSLRTSSRAGTMWSASTPASTRPAGSTTASTDTVADAGTRTSATSSAADLDGVDAVVHMAELSNDPLGQLAPNVTCEINHHGSVHVAATGEGRRRHAVRLHVVVQRLRRGDADLVDEESPLDPQTAYAECKELVERDVGAMADDDFSPTFLRNATAYGASPRMRFDIVLNNLAGLAWTTREIAMASDGTPWRPLVHVLDICAAIAHRPRGAARACARADPQRRRDRAELPGPRDRRDRR